MNMSPKKGTISKGIFMGYFVSFFGGMTASKRLQPSWACPPKELPFLWWQPWWRRGKGFRHGGRSNRQGRDWWLLQRRDGKHLGRRTPGKKKGKKKNRNCLWWFCLQKSFLGVEIFGNPQGRNLIKQFDLRLSGCSIELSFCLMAAKMNIQQMSISTLPRFKVKEMSSKNVRIWHYLINHFGKRFSEVGGLYWCSEPAPDSPRGKSLKSQKRQRLTTF